MILLASPSSPSLQIRRAETSNLTLQSYEPAHTVLTNLNRLSVKLVVFLGVVKGLGAGRGILAKNLQQVFHRSRRLVHFLVVGIVNEAVNDGLFNWILLLLLSFFIVVDDNCLDGGNTRWASPLRRNTVKRDGISRPRAAS